MLAPKVSLKVKRTTERVCFEALADDTSCEQYCLKLLLLILREIMGDSRGRTVSTSLPGSIFSSNILLFSAHLCLYSAGAVISRAKSWWFMPIVTWEASFRGTDVEFDGRWKCACKLESERSAQDPLDTRAADQFGCTRFVSITNHSFLQPLLWISFCEWKARVIIGKQISL